MLLCQSGSLSRHSGRRIPVYLPPGFRHLGTRQQPAPGEPAAAHTWLLLLLYHAAPYHHTYTIDYSTLTLQLYIIPIIGALYGKSYILKYLRSTDRSTGTPEPAAARGMRVTGVSAAGQQRRGLRRFTAGGGWLARRTGGGMSNGSPSCARVSKCTRFSLRSIFILSVSEDVVISRVIHLIATF